MSKKHNIKLKRPSLPLYVPPHMRNKISINTTKKHNTYDIVNSKKNTHNANNKNVSDNKEIYKNNVNSEEISKNIFLSNEQKKYILSIIDELKKNPNLSDDIMHDDFNDVKDCIYISDYEKCNFNHNGNEVSFSEIFEFVFYYIKLMNANYILNPYRKKKGIQESTITDINRKFINLQNMMNKYDLNLSDIPDYNDFINSYPKLNNQVCLISGHGSTNNSKTFIIPNNTYIITFTNIGRVLFLSSYMITRAFIYNNHREIKELIDKKKYNELKKLLSKLNNKLSIVSDSSDNINVKLHIPGMTITDTYISFYENGDKIKVSYTNQYMGYKIYNKDSIHNDMNAFTIINKNMAKHTMNNAYTSTIIKLMGPGIYLFNYCRSGADEENLILSQNNHNNNRIKYKKKILEKDIKYSLKKQKQLKLNNLNLSSNNNKNTITNNKQIHINNNKYDKHKKSLSQSDIEHVTEYYNILDSFYKYINKKKNSYKNKNDTYLEFINNYELIIDNEIRQEYELYVISIIINNIINIYLFLYYFSIDNNYNCNINLDNIMLTRIHYNMLQLFLYFDNNNMDLISDIFLNNDINDNSLENIIYIMNEYLSMQRIYVNYSFNFDNDILYDNVYALNKCCKNTLKSFIENNPVWDNKKKLKIIHSKINSFITKYSEYLKKHIIKFIITIVYKFLKYSETNIKTIIDKSYNILNSINDFTSNISYNYMVFIETICILFHIKDITIFNGLSKYNTENVISSIIYVLNHIINKYKQIYNIYKILNNISNETLLKTILNNITYIENIKIKKKNKKI
jgi:hypothetical protein